MKKGIFSRSKSGFTIVELLVVIVVIGILAAITIVSYTGIQNKATVASLNSDLDNASRLLSLDQVVNSSYPATLALANGGKGINASPDTTYHYNINGQGYCLTATKGTQSYHVTNTLKPTANACVEDGGPVDDNLVARWKFNGDALNSVTDSLHGTVTGATLTTGKNGSANSAYNFSGVGQYINFGNSTDFNSSEITFAAWVKPTVVTGLQEILAKEGQYKYRLSGTNLDILVSAIGGSWTTNCSFGTSVTAGTWYHLATTISSSTRTIVGYVNGVQVGSATLTSPVTAYNSSNLFAAAYNAGGEPLNGAIDDARVYRAALSATYIQALYNDTAF